MSSHVSTHLSCDITYIYVYKQIQNVSIVTCHLTSLSSYPTRHVTSRLYTPFLRHYMFVFVCVCNMSTEALHECLCMRVYTYLYHTARVGDTDVAYLNRHVAYLNRHVAYLNISVTHDLCMYTYIYQQTYVSMKYFQYVDVYRNPGCMIYIRIYTHTHACIHVYICAHKKQ